MRTLTWDPSGGKTSRPATNRHINWSVMPRSGQPARLLFSVVTIHVGVGRWRRRGDRSRRDTAFLLAPRAPLAELTGKRQRAPVGTATAVTALCGYAVIYLAARNLAPNGFGIRGVPVGAFGLVIGAANVCCKETTQRGSLGYGRSFADGRRVPIRCGPPMVGLGSLVVTPVAHRCGAGGTRRGALTIGRIAQHRAGCLHATAMLAGTNR